ncbi:CRISPR-associated endoribonuclease Cas6 [Brevibacillus humidisoli]|uniref:CRISPR-associated endoribonuclease Cas6 n=1 Tax=Brevibacillus humidisoli TaxID=2895522 RepID=UPI001E2CB9FD|nr:CRISPR-associated endoribonuclease Cas6 [Brevibacillus humidisoli]UFJ39861.1 CRISPR-associated endoribonuclease Cas6 [Brevibacillus humidisoli]
MRFKLTLHSECGTIELPVHYNHMIQAAIYRNLSPEFASFLHNQGYVIDKRRFPLFVFSRMIGSYTYVPSQKILRFQAPAYLFISSPVSQFIHDMAQIFLRDGIQLGRQQLRVTEVETSSINVEQDEIKVQTLSPVVAYSTLLRPDGRKYTLYFPPRTSDFKRIVSENLVRKAKLIYGEETEFEPIDIQEIGTHKKHVTFYKSTVIEAYSGRFHLRGDQRLLQTAVDTGLGSKNSMGFGMVRVC